MRKFLLGVLEKMYARRDARMAAAARPATAQPGAAPAAAPSAESQIAEGDRHLDAGALDAALQCYREAIRLKPALALAQVCAGNALYAMLRLPEAESHYRHAIDLDPEYAAARLNLGNVLMAMQRPADAEAAYRVAIRLRRDWPEAWAGLGCALEESAQADAAIEAYREALRLDPAHAGAAFNLSGLLVAADPAAARQVLDEGLRRNPGHPSLLRAQADLHRKLNEHRAAIAIYRALLAADPHDATANSNLLFTLGFLPESDAAGLLEEHRRWGASIAARIPALAVRTEPDPARRLRVGFISPDFCAHAVALFIEPLFRHLDPAKVEMFCYANNERDDEFTGRLQQLVPNWREIRALDDDAVARAIQEDRIDILVDLAGHTQGNRMGVCARKPAPILMTWLGYLSTTGLPAMDYRICDRQTDPEGVAEQWQTETPLRLPNTQWCYESAIDLEPGPLPRLANGYWTFGSFNQSGKLNEPLFEAWAALLAAVPGSRLRVAGLPGGRLPQALAGVLAGKGIGPDRIEPVGRTSLRTYLTGYTAVDVALDSFPYTGGTTTCDALLMGVPVATVAGDRPMARSGVSLLGSVGLQDWIAPSLADLPAMVLRQLADAEALARLRAALPGRMRASPLMDAPRFARDMEALYRRAWQDWCARAG